MSDEQITVSTDLLAAVAKWASGDDMSPIGVVVFRDGEIVATDATRLVRVPMKTCASQVIGEPCFAILRRDLLAAIAAQNVLERDDIEPPIEHDVYTNDAGDTCLTDGPYGQRSITLRRRDGNIVLEVGGIDVLATPRDLSGYPSTAALDRIMPVASGESPPDGITLQPRLLEGMTAISDATWARTSGVRCTAWGEHKQGMLFETKNGVRMVIMPMKAFAEQDVRAKGGTAVSS